MKHRNMFGFTMLEIIVSVGLMAGISLVIVQAFITTTRTNAKVEALKEIKQNGDYAIEVLTRMIRNAESVTSTCASGGTASTVLSIENKDGGVTTLQCLTDSGVARIASSSASGNIYLTSNTVSLLDASSNPTCTNALSFTCASDVGIPASVKIKFTVGQKGVPVLQFEEAKASTFEISVSLRK